MLELVSSNLVTVVLTAESHRMSHNRSKDGIARHVVSRASFAGCDVRAGFQISSGVSEK